MAVPPEFLTLDDVREAQATGLAHFGGQAGERDTGALEAAVMQAQASFDGEYLYEDIFSMAAAYGFHISEAQAFLDGNKRAAVLAMVIFLDLNGFRVREHEDILYLAMLDIVRGDLDKWGLAKLLRQLAGVS
jgi:death-on-curing protein